jgi:hypothetical protein
MALKLTDLPFEYKFQLLVQSHALSIACHALGKITGTSAESWAVSIGEKSLELISSLSPEEVEEAISKIEQSEGFAVSVEL